MKVYYNNHKDKFVEYHHKYYVSNKDKFKEHNQLYYKTNTEKLVEHTREYIKNNSYYITCGCGSKIMRYGNYKHIKSQKHISWYVQFLIAGNRELCKRLQKQHHYTKQHLHLRCEHVPEDCKFYCRQFDHKQPRKPPFLLRDRE